MKTRYILLLVSFLLLLPYSSNAQGGLLRRAINKQIEKKADSAATKKAQENNNNENNEQARPKGLGLGILGGKTDIKHDEVYSFTGRIYSQMETRDKKDVVTTDCFTYFNSGTLNAGMEMKITGGKKSDESVPTKFVFDMNNRCFMMLMDNGSSKTGIISTIPSDSAIAAQAKPGREKQGEQAVVTKTGNTKVIAGYKCDEYKIVEPDQDGYSLAWMTKDLKIKADKRNWGKTGMPSYYGLAAFEGQTMLAMESFDKQNNPVMKMETKEINENFPSKISTAGYSFIKMNFGQAGKK